MAALRAEAPALVVPPAAERGAAADGGERAYTFEWLAGASAALAARLRAALATDDGAEGEFADDPLLDRDGRRRRRVDLGGKNSVRVAAGDALEMLTPGGGGFGSDAGEEGTN